MFRLLLCLFLSLLSAMAWPQAHETASQGVVAIAVRNPWPRLPSAADISAADQDFRGRMGKGVSVTSGPTRMHAPWEKDALQSNKVVMTVQGSSGPAQAMLLVYDFMTNRFVFKGMLLSGVKRYPGDKSTSSMLEAQDMVHLKAGWVPLADIPVQEPQTPVAGEPARLPPQKPLILAVQDDVAAYVQRFKGSCFERVIKLGDPEKFRAAIGNNLGIWPNSPLFYVLTNAEASHQTTTGHNGIMHLRFDPSVGTRSQDQLRSMTHETVHHMELQHDAKRARGAPGVERNTDWMDAVGMAFGTWRLMEQQVIDGTRSPREAWEIYRNLEDQLNALEHSHQPELGMLNDWAGIKVNLAELRRLYRSRDCGTDALRQMVEMADYMRGHPQLSELPASYMPAPANAPAIPPGSKHIIYSMVYDKASGKPLAGAKFYVLQPGMSARDWGALRYGAKYVLAQGTSNASGMVSFDKSLDKGKTYSFLVAREGYKAVSFDNLSIGPDSPEPLKITIRLGK